MSGYGQVTDYTLYDCVCDNNKEPLHQRCLNMNFIYFDWAAFLSQSVWSFTALPISMWNKFNALFVSSSQGAIEAAHHPQL